MDNVDNIEVKKEEKPVKKSVKKSVKKKTKSKAKAKSKKNAPKRTNKISPNDSRFGNKFSEKFKTPAERAVVFKAFCDHLAAGYSEKSFHNGCTYLTVYNMIDKYPDEFDPEELGMAKAKSSFVWEQMGKAGIAGQLKNFNHVAWIWTTKNKLGWKDNIRQEIAYDPEMPPPVAPAPVINVENKIDFSKLSLEELKELERIGSKLENNNGNSNGRS